MASISKAKIRYGGQEQEMVMVPSGNEFGFTTKAAQTLGIPVIPVQLEDLRYRIENGVLIID